MACLLRSCSPGIHPKSRVQGGKRPVRSLFCVYNADGVPADELAGISLPVQVAEPADDIEDLPVLDSHLSPEQGSPPGLQLESPGKLNIRGCNGADIRILVLK